MILTAGIFRLIFKHLGQIRLISKLRYYKQFMVRYVLIYINVYFINLYLFQIGIFVYHIIVIAIVSLNTCKYLILLNYVEDMYIEVHSK